MRSAITVAGIVGCCVSSALIFGADPGNEARLAGGRSAPQRESNQTPPAVPIH